MFQTTTNQMLYFPAFYHVIFPTFTVKGPGPQRPGTSRCAPGRHPRAAAAASAHWCAPGDQVSALDVGMAMGIWGIKVRGQHWDITWCMGMNWVIGVSSRARNWTFILLKTSVWDVDVKRFWYTHRTSVDRVTLLAWSLQMNIPTSTRMSFRDTKDSVCHKFFSDKQLWLGPMKVINDKHWYFVGKITFSGVTLQSYELPNKSQQHMNYPTKYWTNWCFHPQTTLSPGGSSSHFYGWTSTSQELRTAHHITIQVELHFAAGLQGLNFEAPQKGPTMPNVA